MNNALDSAIFQQELQYYGLSGEGASLLQSKEGVIVARVRLEDRTAILKCLENTAFRREISNYDVLRRCGIPTIPVLGQSDRSLLLEDIEASDVYRMGLEGDLDDPAVIRALAKWYKTLHTKGSRYVQQNGEGLYEEWDCITPQTIEAIRESFGLADCEGLRALLEHGGQLRESLDAAPRTLTYNDFYYTNLVVRNDASEAMMLDYNLLGKGCYISDIRNVIYWLSEENTRLFFSVYGEVDAGLMLLDRICAPVVSLFSAMSRGIFPAWAREAAEALRETPALLERLYG